MSKKKMTFEEKLKRIEEIAEKMESSECNLEEVVQLYEESIILSKELLEFLNTSELKINELKVDIDNTFSKSKISID